MTLAESIARLSDSQLFEMIYAGGLCAMLGDVDRRMPETGATMREITEACLLERNRRVTERSAGK